MMNTEVLIVSSNRHPASRLQTLLTRTPGISLLPCVPDRERLSGVLSRHTPHVIFMPLSSSPSLWAHLFLQTSPLSQVIATTPHPELAPRAFAYNCAGLLTAPFQEGDLHRALLKALFRRRLWLEGSRHPPHRGLSFPLAARKKGIIRFFDPSEVLYFKAEDKYVFLHTGRERYFCRFTLRELETRLDPRHFCRIRRNVIAAFHGILEVEKNGAREISLTLKGPEGVKVRAGRKYIPSVRKWLRL